jgi:uracil-DNA glycosylase
MGAPAAQAILSTTESITSIRGKPKWWGPYIVLPTYHPAVDMYPGDRGKDLRADFRDIPKLLREERAPNAEDKAEFWCPRH